MSVLPFPENPPERNREFYLPTLNLRNLWLQFRVERAQRKLAPKEDLSQYPPGWFAIRRGRVAVYSEFVDVIATHPDVRHTDVITSNMGLGY
jgi:hypothetical protein